MSVKSFDDSIQNKGENSKISSLQPTISEKNLKITERVQQELQSQSGLQAETELKIKREITPLKGGQVETEPVVVHIPPEPVPGLNPQETIKRLKQPLPAHTKSAKLWVVSAKNYLLEAYQANSAKVLEELIKRSQAAINLAKKEIGHAQEQGENEEDILDLLFIVKQTGEELNGLELLGEKLRVFENIADISTADKLPDKECAEVYIAFAQKKLQQAYHAQTYRAIESEIDQAREAINWASIKIEHALKQEQDFSELKKLFSAIKQIDEELNNLMRLASSFGKFENKVKVWIQKAGDVLRMQAFTSLTAEELSDHLQDVKGLLQWAAKRNEHVRSAEARSNLQTIQDLQRQAQGMDADFRAVEEPLIQITQKLQQVLAAAKVGDKTINEAHKIKELVTQAKQLTQQGPVFALIQADKEADDIILANQLFTSLNSQLAEVANIRDVKELQEALSKLEVTVNQCPTIEAYRTTLESFKAKIADLKQDCALLVFMNKEMAALSNNRSLSTPKSRQEFMEAQAKLSAFTSGIQASLKTEIGSQLFDGQIGLWYAELLHYSPSENYLDKLDSTFIYTHIVNIARLTASVKNLSEMQIMHRMCLVKRQLDELTTYFKLAGKTPDSLKEAQQEATRQAKEFLNANKELLELNETEKVALAQRGGNVKIVGPLLFKLMTNMMLSPDQLFTIQHGPGGRSISFSNDFATFSSLTTVLDKEFHKEWIKLQQDPLLGEVLEVFYNFCFNHLEAYQAVLPPGFIVDLTDTVSKEERRATHFTELLVSLNISLANQEQLLEILQSSLPMPPENWSKNHPLIKALKSMTSDVEVQDARAMIQELQEIVGLWKKLERSLFKILCGRELEGPFPSAQQIEALLLEKRIVDLSQLALFFQSEEFLAFSRSTALFTGKMAQRQPITTAFSQVLTDKTKNSIQSIRLLQQKSMVTKGREGLATTSLLDAGAGLIQNVIMQITQQGPRWPLQMRECLGKVPIESALIELSRVGSDEAYVLSPDLSAHFEKNPLVALARDLIAKPIAKTHPKFQAIEIQKAVVKQSLKNQNKNLSSAVRELRDLIGY